MTQKYLHKTMKHENFKEDIAFWILQIENNINNDTWKGYWLLHPCTKYEKVLNGNIIEEIVVNHGDLDKWYQI